jgi:poly(3-hydroxybutyrate) depolymerase
MIRRPFLWLAAAAVLGGSASGFDQIVLKDGRMIEGVMGRVSSMVVTLTAPVANGDDEATPKAQLIVFVDNDLCRTFVPRRFIAESPIPSAVAPVERFKLKQPVTRSGRQVLAVGPIVRVTPFDEFGRRIFRMQGAGGPIDIIQGITEITPTYTVVQALEGYIWDMRISTQSIPRETLEKILLRRIDQANIEDRLKLVRLYLQSERYKDASEALEQVVKDFPEIADRTAQTRLDLTQLGARRLLKEIDVRQEAGQHERVTSALLEFPSDSVAGQILEEVRQKLDGYQKMSDERQRVVTLLHRDAWYATSGHDAQTTAMLAATELAMLGPASGGLPFNFAGLLPAVALAAGGQPDLGMAQRLAPVLGEIADSLNYNTVGRLAAYQQFADDPKLLPGEKLSLAISGWILGSENATLNLEVSLSLARVRELIAEYVREPLDARREAILDELQASEGATVPMVAQIVAHMRPIVPTPSAAEKAPGLFELSVPAIDRGPAIIYYVQLPPEYDPYRRYPAVVTLHGGGTSPQQQIDWWAAQAARYGTILIAPAWTKTEQLEYEYGGREHAAVLDSLRDAVHRFAIDTDRVFLSGHSMGGDAAWDIGLAHPDTWAGVIPVVSEADRYCDFYFPNARQVPVYMVAGELDGSKTVDNAQVLDRIFKAGYNLTVVEYKGRGHEHFSDDIQNIFNWMERCRRDYFPREFDCRTMRTFDNFFWWVEVNDFPPKVVADPSQWPPRDPSAMPVTGTVNGPNLLSVKTGAGKVTLWLTPDLVDFGSKVSVTVNGKKRQVTLEPSMKVLLDDVRIRGDRQHPFWARYDAAGRG